MNSSAEYSGSSGVNGYAYAIGASLGVLVLIIIISLAAYFCTRGVDSSARTATNHYPKLLYSKARLEPRGNIDLLPSCCSICLGDYKDSDVLRLLPDCGHVFHLKCVDCWIRRHPTCPICRNSCSSMPTPLSTPLAEVAPLAVSRH
ncbi:RING-H2 finger protein [Salix suchowensis]|nr:RING-H2 finger protein [Salix suchowensis]